MNVLDRAGDLQAPLADRRDHFRICVADGNFVSVAGQSGRDRAADGTAAEHEVAHGAKCYNTVKAAAIPKIPYLQNAS